MQRKRAGDFDQRVLELYDGYAHGKLTKRAFIEQAAKYTAGTAGALAVLGQLKPDYALANQVAPDDPAIVTERVDYASPDGNGTVRVCWRDRPAARGRCRRFWWCTRIAG